MREISNGAPLSLPFACYRIAASTSRIRIFCCDGWRPGTFWVEPKFSRAQASNTANPTPLSVCMLHGNLKGSILTRSGLCRQHLVTMARGWTASRGQWQSHGDLQDGGWHAQNPVCQMCHYVDMKGQSGPSVCGKDPYMLRHIATKSLPVGSYSFRSFSDFSSTGRGLKCMKSCCITCAHRYSI